MHSPIRATEFLRDALRYGPVADTTLRELARKAGIDTDTFTAARGRLLLTLAPGTTSWTVRLEHAACIVCDDWTDQVETAAGLPLHPDCPTPITTWQWKRARPDGKRGRETVTVAHRRDCWRTGVNERRRPAGGRHSVMATCGSVLDLALAGQPFCDAPVVWRVTTVIGRKGRQQTWCDEHLPVADRPEVTA